MLLFLRRLKHLEFMSGKFRKYLLYAIGEMALVVVGILIALQIDSGSEALKNSRAAPSLPMGLFDRRNESDRSSDIPFPTW